ncbi:MAG: iron chelate uptake ABC transporter family permease subunit, partial [Photobacterium halotolerans]
MRSGQQARLLLIIPGLIVVIGYLLNLTVPYSQGLPLLWETLLNYDPTNYQHIIVNLTYLPRLVVAVLCGFSLAVAGAVMQ